VSLAAGALIAGLAFIVFGRGRPAEDASQPSAAAMVTTSDAVPSPPSAEMVPPPEPTASTAPPPAPASAAGSGGTPVASAKSPEAPARPPAGDPKKPALPQPSPVKTAKVLDPHGFGDRK
jgi:hypothetical protein